MVDIFARKLANEAKFVPALLGYTHSSQTTIDQFRDILIETGLNTITPKTREDDIKVAYGQLGG